MNLMLVLRMMEGWMIEKLLSSPSFHRGVRTIHKQVHELRHGPNPSTLGGTKIDSPDAKSLIQHFIEELKDQAKGATKK